MAFGSSNQISRKPARITCNVRIPKDEYHGDYAHLKRWLQQAIGAEKAISNSMAMRLALWGLTRLKYQAVHAGPEAERQLSHDLANQVRRMAAGQSFQ